MLRIIRKAIGFAPDLSSVTTGEIVPVSAHALVQRAIFYIPHSWLVSVKLTAVT